MRKLIKQISQCSPLGPVTDVVNLALEVSVHCQRLCCIYVQAEALHRAPRVQRHGEEPGPGA